MLTLRLSVQPSSFNPCCKAATRRCASGSFAANPPNIAIRRIRSDGCAVAAHGASSQAPTPLRSMMNARRFVCRESTILRGDGGSVMTVSPSRPEARRRFGSETASELGAPVASSISDSCLGASPHQQGRDTKMAMLSFGGIDVSKDRLDITVLPDEQCSSVSNDAAGWAELIEQLRGSSITAIGVEASGGYERGVVRALLA